MNAGDFSEALVEVLATREVPETIHFSHDARPAGLHCVDFGFKGEGPLSVAPNLHATP